MRDDGDGPEKITSEGELARVQRLGVRVFLLAVGTACLLTGLLFTVQ